MRTTSELDRHLRQRAGRWHYYRRVPKRFQRFDDRGTIRLSLGTGSLEIARIRRDQLAAADDAFWAAMASAEISGNGDEIGLRSAAAQRYEAARAAAMASGFRYAPMEELLREENVEQIVRRVLTLDKTARSEGALKPFKVEALLGGIEPPKITVSEALRVYVEDIAIDDQYGKSEAQAAQWRKVKRLSIDYFIDQVGDLPLVDITRDHALAYQRFWSDRVTGKNGQKPVMPNTANRHLGNIRLLYGSYFKHIGEEDRPNPFRGLFFKAKSRTEVPAFPNDWVRTQILKPGVLLGLRLELQLITYILIETGCRPSEIINLRAEDIRLEHAVPHIAIAPRKGRQIKTESSIRDIPLVGVALEAARRAPGGFPHYHDRNELFSANMMKAFRTRRLFPTTDHVIYSFRHAFEQRMQEANIDYGLRCLLMGHANTRPSYGDGGSLAYRRDELLKISHPFSDEIFKRIDTEFGLAHQS